MSDQDRPTDDTPDFDAPKAATVEELERRCGHECLRPPGHDGPHFYGYRGGPHSYEGVKAERDALRAEVDRLRAERDQLEANAKEDRSELLRCERGARQMAAENKRLRAERDQLVEGIREHERAARADYADSEWAKLADYDERLWALLDTSDDQEDDK